MHAHERTMLARFGFADPDRREPKHDLACQYLALPESTAKLQRILSLEHGPQPFHDVYRPDRFERSGLISRQVESCTVSFEHPISKGSGQYSTTIGFIDLLLNYRICAHRTQQVQRRREDTGRLGVEEIEDYDLQENATVGIEVKATLIRAAEVIRQINLYRSYTRPERGWGDWRGEPQVTHWVVATVSPFSQLDVDALKNQDIVCVQLGRDFEAFLTSRATEAATTTMEI